MLGHHLLTFYRSVSRHRLYAALNVLGLAIGLAVFVALTIAARFEFSYDRWLPNAERTFRVSAIMRIPGRPEETIAIGPGPVLPSLQADFGQAIEAGTRVLNAKLPVIRGAQTAYETLAFADPTFFDVFRLPAAAGDPARAVADTVSLALTETTARKYFGRVQVVGERLTVVTDGTPRDYRVVGVLRDLPDNTHLKLGFVARLDRSVLPDRAEYLEQWNATNYHTYVRLPSARAAADLQRQLQPMLERREAEVASWMGLQLDALPNLHFNTNSIGAMKPGVDRRFVVMLQIVGALTLLLGVINYVNLSTARAMLRAQEIALRKTFGATRGALVLQLLIESVVVSLVAGVAALALVELALPVLNTAVGSAMDLSYFGADGVAMPVLALTVLVGLAAGAYPALVISRFRPAAVLGAARAPGGGRGAAALREVLVVLQFSVSIALMIGMAVVFAQADFVRRSDVGYKREGLLVVSQVGAKAVWPRRLTLLEAVRRTPGVTAATLSGRSPSSPSLGASQTFIRAGQPREQAPSLGWEIIADDYLRATGGRLLAGRDLGAANRMDELVLSPGARTPANVLLNATAARALGLSDPAEVVGQTIRTGSGRPMTVVGVVQDLRFGPPREKVPPVIYGRSKSPDATETGNPALIVRYEGDPRAVTAALRRTWSSVTPGTPFTSETVASALDEYYRPDARRGVLLTLGAVVAALIGSLGLYGLATFSSQRRTREIGIRKVLGASTSDVVRLLLMQFLRPVLVANLIAWPLAWVAMRGWLSGFDQRVALSPAYFLAASALACLIAVATVAGQALRVARAEPAKALRYE